MHETIPPAPAPTPVMPENAAANASGDAIVIDHVSKRFGETLAVDALSFRVGDGETVGLLGGNGAGKTTTIAMLLGLLLPSAGKITILGEDMIRHRHRVLPRLNFSSPYVELPHRLTVSQNLRVYGKLYGIVDCEARITALAEDFDLTAFLHRPSGKLSSGQKTRVALAKALLNGPELLLLDEPTASLDPETADWVRNYLASYQRHTGATILLASHNMTEVERLCSDVLMMRGGQLVDRGPPLALIERYGRRDLEEVFLAIARGENAATAGPSQPPRDNDD